MLPHGGHMLSYSRRGFLAAGAASALTACSNLPRGAPQKNEVLEGADAETPEFAVYQVDRSFLSRVRGWPVTGTRSHTGWIARSNGVAVPTIAPGDRLDLRIWDSADTSLITAPDQKATELTGLTVAPSGEIFVPYVEDIKVAGMTPERARTAIQDRMEAIIPSAQVQLNLSSGRRNSVDLVGGVAAPGRYPLEDLNTSVLNIISQGGGVPEGMNNPRVRLVRDGRVYLTPLSRLYESPSLDTMLRGGDKIIVEGDDRFFLALGAAGSERVIDFTKDDFSALRAVTEMGGLMDSRADPEGILVLRNYPESAVSPSGPAHSRVVFTLDLTTADGLFSAKEFQINSGDVVMATESPVTSTQTIFSLLGSAFGLATTVSAATDG